MPVNLALIGAGRIAQVHAKAINQVSGACLKAVCDVEQIAADALAHKYGVASMSIDDIANDEQIDGVLICTPTDTHADLIEQFCLCGKAVFCEKPIDLNRSRVKQTLALVAQKKAQLMLGFQRRFDPDFAALKAQIELGKIGEVEMVNITSRDPSAPAYEYIKNSGGIFRDMTIHDFDMARWLLGEPITHVVATASVLTDQTIAKYEDYDSVNVLLTTASGKQCVISNSRRASFGYDQRIEVLGSLGAISALNHHEANIELANDKGYQRPPLQHFFISRYELAYAHEIAAFVDALATGNAMPINGNDGLQALALADAACLSVQEKRVVSISELL
jgi:myo-inositol 2-dehydrogenase/D-chiro-inositol 1-dehydrogenase